MRTAPQTAPRRALRPLTALLTPLLVVSLLAAPVAQAGPDHKRRDHYEHRDDRRHDHRHDHRHGHRDDHRRHGHDDRRYHGERTRVEVYRAPRHTYYRHHWSRGERLPVVYRETRYVVRDYPRYRLYAPPRGHHWVRVDNDVVLATIATGVIAAAVYGVFD